MSQSIHHDRLLVWSLATFHTAFFMAVLIALLYASGSLGALLGGLNTLVGLAIFGALWTTTWYCTRKAWLRMKWTLGQRLDTGKLGSLSARWGGMNGVLFLAILIIVQLISGITNFLLAPQTIDGMILRSSDILAGLSISLMFVLACGSPVAFIVGAIFGVLFSAVDVLLIDSAIWFYTVAMAHSLTEKP